MPSEVSVIIPVYNRSNSLARAVKSCLRTNLGVEVVVVDDGSDEDIRSVLDEFVVKNEKHAIRLVRQENLGACAARNAGLDLAVGHYVKFLDSDDELLSGALEQEVAAARENNVDVVLSGWVNRFSETEKPPEKVDAPDLSRGIDDMLLGRGPWTSAALYRRSFVKDLRWDPEWTKAQDWGWALRVCLAGASYYTLPVFSAVYNHHDGQRITGHGDQLLRSTRARQSMLKMAEQTLREQGRLTEERCRLFSQYYYKDRIVLCGHSSGEWRALWMHCQQLAPGFFPHESSGLIRMFIACLGVYRGVLWYVRLKKGVYERFHRASL